MSQVSKYDIMLKQLEIIYQDSMTSSREISDEQRQKIINIMGNISRLSINDLENANVGDTFKDIKDSDIANRSTIRTDEKPIITEKESGLDEALERLGVCILSATENELSSDRQREYVSLLDELRQASARSSKVSFGLRFRLKQLFVELMTIERTKNTALEVRPVIEAFWEKILS